MRDEPRCDTDDIILEQQQQQAEKKNKKLTYGVLAHQHTDPHAHLLTRTRIIAQNRHDHAVAIHA